MALDPQLERIFARMAPEGIPDLSALPLQDVRHWYFMLGSTLGGPVLPMEVQDLFAESSEGRIPLRAYYPAGLGSRPHPGLIYLHGGGWTVGSIETHDKECRRLAQSCNVVVMSVGYRLAPEHPFPAGPQDVIAASRWILLNAESFGVDSNRVAIAGDSAGGSLSAVACLANRDLQGPTIRCQILIYPSTDNGPESGLHLSRTEQARTPPLPAEGMKMMVGSFLPNSEDGKDWRASPLLAEDHSNLPPALVITGGYDPLRDEGMAYAQKLIASGVDVLHRHFAGMTHGFFEMGGELDSVEDVIQTVGLWLKRYND